MRTVEYRGEVAGLVRSHPWSDSASAHYLDLRADPALIRRELEDFVPWAHYPAIERFYRLLAWINGAASRLESTDCAFSPPQRNERPDIVAELECSGRVVILFRDLARNLDPEALPALARALHVALARIDPTLELGVLGTTIAPVRFRALEEAMGSQLLVSFWAWGDSELDVMTNLARVFANLAQALQRAGGAHAP